VNFGHILPVFSYSLFSFTIAGANDTLETIASKAGVTVDDLLTFNHGLQKDATTLPESALCVAASKTHAKRCLSGKNSHKKSTTDKPAAKKPAAKKPSTSTSTTKAPSNAVNHIVPNCNKYATVLPSDSDCTAFSKTHGIAESNLYKWNTGLHHAGDHLCDNLDTGKAYCVGVKN
jgi:hypothetical protein